jgi:prepilin-type N-terminal cleavage/methylation domain-containing protein
MMRARGEHGFTLIELLVSMALSLIVIGSVVSIMTVFLKDSNYDQLRDQAQNDSRTMVDRMSRELRSAVSVSTGSSGLLERANPYDLIFETVNPSTVYGGQNSYNQYRVRYCLDSNQTLWRQTETWTTSTPPAVPASTACPDTSSSDFIQSSGSPCCVELTDVTNEIGGDTTRPLFTYGPTGWTSTSQIQEVQVNVITDLNPGHLPGPSPQLTTGIFLRNENSPPQLPDFSVTWTATGANTRDVVLNGSAASDPNGQTLLYQWYNGGTCSSPSNPLSPGGTQVYDAGTYSTGSQTFVLVITDTQGLTACLAKTVTIT